MSGRHEEMGRGQHIDPATFAVDDEDTLEVFPTGLSALDDLLGGGIAAGSLVLLECPPDSSGEQFGFALLRAAAHPTLYLSAVRPKEMIQSDVEATDAGMGTTEIHGEILEVDGRDDNQAPFTEVTESFASFSGSSIVVDTLTDLLDSTSESKTALTTLGRFVRDRDGIAYLIVHPPQTEAQRELVRLARSVSDVVFKYSPADSREGTDVLSVTKVRRMLSGAEELPFSVNLEIGQQLTVSREQSFS